MYMDNEVGSAVMEMVIGYEIDNGRTIQHWKYNCIIHGVL